MCPCYSRRAHYPTLEKPGVQNVAACKNQGKQHKLTDHWTSIKMLLLKKISGDNGKKDKIDWNTSFNKRFYILKNQM